jgi:integrase
MPIFPEVPMKGGLSVKRLEKLTAPGRYGDGRGLYLDVKSPTNRSWLFRFEREGRERFVGLGAVHTFSLDEARERARVCRQQLADGIDPAEARKREEEQRALAAAKTKPFAECAQSYFDDHSARWRNAKHRKQFLSSLKTYAYPIIGEIAVGNIDVGLVLKVLEQPMEGTTFWRARPETASRVRGRIEAVLSWATVRGYRTGDNPARWTGFLSEALAGRATKVRHHPALPYAELPGFMADLRQREGVSARALEYTILCSARTGATIGATWPEIDLKAKVWTVPPQRTGAKITEQAEPRRVPLSPRAVEILENLPRENGNPFVFVGPRKGRGLSNMAMAQLLERMGRDDITVHGFRSSFKDWCSEQTNYPNHVSEAALWHAVADQVEAAYRRTDLLARRARLMADWAKFAASSTTVQGEVVPMRRRA